MENVPITNEMLYQFLKEFRGETLQRFELVDKQFEQVGQQFEQVGKQFEIVHRELDRLREDMHELKSEVKGDKEKLQKVYETRDNVTVKFTRSWALASLFVSAFAVLLARAFERLLL